MYALGTMNPKAEYCFIRLTDCMPTTPSALCQVALPYDQPAKEVGVRIPIIPATHSIQCADLGKSIYRYATSEAILFGKLLHRSREKTPHHEPKTTLAQITARSIFVEQHQVHTSL